MNGTKIDNAEYHDSRRLSWSKLRVFLKSPMAYHHRFIEGNDQGTTAAMAFGSLVHCLTLESEVFVKDYVVWTGQSRSTKAGKEEWASIERDGRIPVKESDYLVALSVAEAAYPHLPDGETELAFYADLAGVQCQCKVDRMADGVLYDLKTCADIDRFKAGMEYGDWLFGDVFYRMVIEAATGTRPPPVRYVGVQTSAPHDVLVLIYPEELFDPARDAILAHLARFDECRKSGVWPGVAGFAKGPQEVRVSGWHLGRIGIDLPSVDDMFSAEYDETQSI